MQNTLLETVSSAGGLKIEIWHADFQHAVDGHPEVSIERVRSTLKDPLKVIQSKSSANVCLFYSIEIDLNELESLFFCVVVAVIKSGYGRMVTAYEANFIKNGTELYSKK